MRPRRMARSNEGRVATSADHRQAHRHITKNAWEIQACIGAKLAILRQLEESLTESLSG